MAYECFDVSINKNIAHIVLSRPEALNTITPAFWRELPEIVRDIDENARARVIVISAQGRHFSAGLDLSAFGGLSSDAADQEKAEQSRTRGQFFRHVLELQKTFSCLEAARAPVLMAAHGACIGGAVDFASACDMRYSTQDAFFCIQEINIALTADVGTFPRFPRLVPEGLARELAYTGRRLYAEEAKALGFINEVFADHDAMIAKVMELAREIAARSPMAIWGTKEILNYGRDHTIEEGLRHVALWQSGMMPNRDIGEAVTAKAEKRDPTFSDLLADRKAG
ncbi:MAG: crotonase/enoyl-CoA hydratase family protein [Parvularculales bacterium]